MTRGRARRTPAWVAVAALAACAMQCPDAAQDTAPPPSGAPTPPTPRLVEVSDGRYLMGTVLDVTLLGRDEALLRRHLDAVFARVARLEDVASRHRTDSELSRFNRAAGSPPAPSESPELRALLEHSVAAGRRTAGAFDVTVGPLIALWTRAAELGRWPTDDAIAGARALVGYQAILLGPGGTIALASPGRAVDFGGIAKGFALDAVRDDLLAAGVDRGLLDFGGSSVWAMGRARDGGPWRFELDAREPGGPPRVLALEDAALSVSSSLGDSATIGGRVVGHVIDPRTGYTIDEPRTAVAIGSSATLAEVWSTALLVLGADEGMALLREDDGPEAWVRFESGRSVSTPGFARFWAMAVDEPENEAEAEAEAPDAR